MTPWIRIAKIVRTKGSKGSVVCESANGLPFLLSEGLHVSIVPPLERDVRQTVVRSVDKMGDGQHAVKLASVDDLASAKPLEGHWLLAARKDIPALPKRFAPDEWRGFSVEDLIFGNLGTITDIDISPAQSRMTVTGDKGVTVIPIVDAFIVSIDQERRHIQTHIPQGLIGIGGEDGDDR